ncbi:ATP-binding protein, partial [Salmonella enterica]|nr:ATP-binding protein [Salmonella enterica]
MDAELNPYTPGSGRRPPALTGRDATIDGFDLVVARSKRGVIDRGLMLSGLRGVGKTAL